MVDEDKAKLTVQESDPEFLIINNEVRNIKKEKELERPHRPSSILKYRQQQSEESISASKSEEAAVDDKVSQGNSSSFIQPLTFSTEHSEPSLEVSKDAQGPDLLFDPDEDPEEAARIDAELQAAAAAPAESEKPVPPYLPAPPKGIEYTLVLDLDETLIHYRDDEEYYLVRPGVNKFLQELSPLYDIVLFTASVKKYADWIVDHIDPHRYISHRLYRRHTVFKDAMYIKDLSTLGRDLRKTLIIDNLYESFLSQPDNGILVKSWYDDMEDTELLTLLPFLRGLVEDQVPDVREVLKRIMNSNSEEGEGEGDAEGEDIEGEAESPSNLDEVPKLANASNSLHPGNLMAKE